MEMTGDKIKLVIINEHTFGYIFPGSGYASVLHASVLKGATGTTIFYDPILLSTIKKIRLATRKDFDEYRIEYTQYARHPEEYEFIAN